MILHGQGGESHERDGLLETYLRDLRAEPSTKAIKEGHVEGVTQFVTTRFGNVLGSNGSASHCSVNRLPRAVLTVTHPDIIRFFMLIPEACRLVLRRVRWVTVGRSSFDMGKTRAYHRLGERMIQLSGAKNVGIRFTAFVPARSCTEEVLNDEEITPPTFHRRSRSPRYGNTIMIRFRQIR